MANETKTKKPVASASKPKKEVTKAPVENKNETVEENEIIKVKELDPSMYVTVRNGYNGSLVYKSKKSGERFVWDSFGDSQDMQLAELKYAKGSSKTFFINNWFLFDDPEIISWLGMEQYYKLAMTFDEFDDLFSKDADEISETVKNLQPGQKKTVAYRAKQLIADGTIDSMKMITALEKSLGADLVER